MIIIDECRTTSALQSPQIQHLSSTIEREKNRRINTYKLATKGNIWIKMEFIIFINFNILFL